MHGTNRKKERSNEALMTSQLIPVHTMSIVASLDLAYSRRDDV